MLPGSYQPVYSTPRVKTNQKNAPANGTLELAASVLCCRAECLRCRVCPAYFPQNRAFGGVKACSNQGEIAMTAAIGATWTMQLDPKALATGIGDLPVRRRTRRPRGILVALAILTASTLGHAVEPWASNRPPPIVRSQPSEIIYEGMASFGNYKVFGAAESEKLYAAGVEVDRQLWPRVLGARLDYVAEFLPVLLLSQPVKADIWGNPQGRAKEWVPGMGITPIGFRLLWRDGRPLMPYFETKASVLGFTQKALSPYATYENWSFHSTAGLKVKLHGRYDLRLGLLSDLHFSNAFVVRSNPALDVMNVDVGIVVHLPGGGLGR